MVVGNVNELIEFASFLIWVTYGAAMSCVLILRKTRPNVPRPYRVPTVIPIFTIGVAIFLSVMPIITAPSVKYLLALAFIAIGVAVYTPFVYLKKRPKLMSMII